MSGVISGVAKVFKKVTKSVVGQVLLTAAVGYLTAGIGTTLLGSIAPSLSGGLMGSVLSGAISGALTGGIVSGLTGQSIGKGLLLGAAGGAIGGGLKYSFSGAGAGANAGTASGGVYPEGVGPEVDMMGGNAVAAEAASATAPGGSGSILSAGSDGGLPGDAYNPIETASAGAGPGAVAPGAGYDIIPPSGPDMSTDLAVTPSGAAASGGGGGFLSRATDWIEANPKTADLVTSVGGGLAKGAMTALAGDAQADAYAERNKILADKYAQEQANLAWTRASHDGATAGLLPASAIRARQAPAGARTPAQTYAYPQAGNNSRFQWNPQTGRLEVIAVA